MAHCYFRVCFHHNKQCKKANIVNNIAVISSDSYQTKTWWTAEIAKQLFWVTEVSFRTKQPLWILFIAQFTLSYLKLCMRYLINIALKSLYFRSLTLPFVSKLRRRNIFREMADVKYWHDVKKQPLRHARESSNTHAHLKRHFLAPVEVPEITFVVGRVHRPTGIQGLPVRS